MTTEEKDGFVKTWGRSVWDAVLRRMERGQSMTASEIVNELGPPAAQREKLKRLVVWAMLATALPEDPSLNATNKAATFRLH